MEINSTSQIGNNVSYHTDNIQRNTNENKDIVINKAPEDEYNNNKINGQSKKDLDNALKKLNKFLEDEPVHAEYSVHKDLKVVMIKIVDNNTKDVVMEIPPEKILDMVASLCKQVGLIDKKA